LGRKHFDGLGIFGLHGFEAFEFLVGVEVEAEGKNDAIGVIAEADDQGEELGELRLQGSQGSEDETGGGTTLPAAVYPHAQLFNPFPVFLIVGEPPLFQ